MSGWTHRTPQQSKVVRVVRRKQAVTPMKPKPFYCGGTTLLAQARDRK